MRICILSDSHDHIPLLDYAVAEAKSRGAKAVIHCGDVVAPSTLKCLTKHRLPPMSSTATIAAICLRLASWPVIPRA